MAAGRRVTAERGPSEGTSQRRLGDDVTKEKTITPKFLGEQAKSDTLVPCPLE